MGKPRPRLTPPPPPVPGAVWVPLTKGQFALVDEADYPLVAEYSWYCLTNGRSKHAASKTKGVHVYMHRLILGVRGQVDHADGNGLNCRRENLRPANDKENRQNSPIYANNTSGFKGVSKVQGSGKWRANISVNGQQTHLGCFARPDDAARAYDAAARKHFGAFARTNFNFKE